MAHLHISASALWPPRSGSAAGNRHVYFLVCYKKTTRTRTDPLLSSSAPSLSPVTDFGCRLRRSIGLTVRPPWPRPPPLPVTWHGHGPPRCPSLPPSRVASPVRRPSPLRPAFAHSLICASRISTRKQGRGVRSITTSTSRTSQPNVSNSKGSALLLCAHFGTVPFA